MCDSRSILILDANVREFLLRSIVMTFDNNGTIYNEDIKNLMELHIKGEVTGSRFLKRDQMAVIDISSERKNGEILEVEVRVHGEKAQTIGALWPDGVIEVTGALSIHRTPKGFRQPKVVVCTEQLKFGKRGEKHFAKLLAVGYVASKVQDVETATYDKMLAGFEVGVKREVRGEVVKEYLETAAFAGLGKIAIDYLRPGMQLRVEGNLSISRWRQEGGKGQNMAKFRVAANKITFGKELTADETPVQNAA